MPQAQTILPQDHDNVVALNTAVQHSMLLERRSVYGRDKMYPACDRSKILAKIAGTTTLTNRTIELARDMGFVVSERHGRSIWGDE